MGLWDKKEDDPNLPAEAAPAIGGVEGMILKMVAGNPALAKAFDGIQAMLVDYVERQKRIEDDLKFVRSLLTQNRTDLLASLPGLPSGEARGIISDGERCPQCGASGECHPDCPLGSGSDGGGRGASGDGGGDGGLGGGSGGGAGGDTVSPSAS